MALEATRTEVRNAGAKTWLTKNSYSANQGYVYEAQVTDADELIAGRACSLGTNDYELTLYDPDKGLFGFFDMQFARGGVSATGRTHGHSNFNELYLKDGEAVRSIADGYGVLIGTLDDGQTVTKGARLQAESATGKLQLQTTGQCVGIAEEALDLSGTPGDSLLKFKPIFDSDRIKVETLTADTHVLTLTHVPIDISYVDIKTGTATGGLILTYTDDSPGQGFCYGVKASKTITCNATDAVLTAEVWYTF